METIQLLIVTSKVTITRQLLLVIAHGYSVTSKVTKLHLIKDLSPLPYLFSKLIQYLINSLLLIVCILSKSFQETKVIFHKTLVKSA